MSSCFSRFAWFVFLSYHFPNMVTFPNMVGVIIQNLVYPPIITPSLRSINYYSSTTKKKVFVTFFLKKSTNLCKSMLDLDVQMNWAILTFQVIRDNFVYCRWIRSKKLHNVWMGYLHKQYNSQGDSNPVFVELINFLNSALMRCGNGTKKLIMVI